MARPNPVILPAKVHLDAAKTVTLSGSTGLQRKAQGDASSPDVAVYNFLGSDAIVVQHLAGNSRCPIRE